MEGIAAQISQANRLADVPQVVAARDQLRREIEIIGQLLLCQHVQLFALRAAPVVIAPRRELDEPDDVRLVLRFQILIFGAGELVRADIRALRENRLGHIVVDRRIRHVLQHEAVQLKAELGAIPPRDGVVPLHVRIRARLHHESQRLLHAPPLNEVRADLKVIGLLLVGAGDIERRVRVRRQTGEIGNAAHDRPGIRGLAGRPVHDPKFLPVCVRDRRTHGRSVVIADLVDKDLRIFDLRRRASQRQILRLFGALRRDHAGIDRDVVKQRHRVAHHIQTV